MGITRIGEIACGLPRAGISRRLSPAAVLDLDIALGTARPPPRRAFVPRRVRFRERCDFETEIETVRLFAKRPSSR